MKRTCTMMDIFGEKLAELMEYGRALEAEGITHLEYSIKCDGNDEAITQMAKTIPEIIKRNGFSSRNRFEISGE